MEKWQEPQIYCILTRPLDILLVDGPNPTNDVGWLHNLAFIITISIKKISSILTWTLSINSR